MFVSGLESLRDSWVGQEVFGVFTGEADDARGRNSETLVDIIRSIG